MGKTKKLSLIEATLININIMLGSGIFINVVLLAQQVSALSGFLYLANSLMITPLILSMAALMKLHPHGGFYTFGSEELSSFWGFLSAWSYFIGKLASASVMTHASILLLQSVMPPLYLFKTLYLDCIVIILFTGLNFLHMKTSMAVQVTTFCVKLIPIFFVFFAGLYLFFTGKITNPYFYCNPIKAQNIIQSIPLVLFTALGFEATLSLSSQIKNAKENGPKALLGAFFFVTILLFGFQTIFYGILGQSIISMPDYLCTFPTLISQIIYNPIVTLHLKNILHIAIACSALGGAYGILFSTHWNLYTIAQSNSIAGSKNLLRLNRYQMPINTILIQAFICLFYLFNTHGNQIPLQLTASFGCIIAYTISIISLILAKKRHTVIPLWVSLCALLNCCIFAVASFYTLATTKLSSLFLFLSMIFIGIIFYAINSKSKLK